MSWNFGLKPVPQVARPYETTSQKFARKCRENPYVPIGGALTVVNLVMAVLNLARGESRMMNYWLRGRVAMQGLTIVALLIGASRMGELDWGPDRFQRTVHWDLRQLLLQEEKSFLGRKTAAQLMDETEGKIYGQGAMARRSEVLMGLGRGSESGKSESGKKSKGWMGLLSTESKPAPESGKPRDEGRL
ncbi:HIG1 domain family member 2A [Mycena venus]|uniref:HIG1 domain family member 2A n=1 Tax=Mycena venus TaxID=2733690 RepID=A0A8H6XKC1_9AGAR|nr:HIG1 domain family member 2A [Mycena venus]